MSVPKVNTPPPATTTGLTAESAELVRQQKQMQAEGFAQSMAMLDLQREQAQKSEAIAALSNVMKNAHDSAMLVINNAKG